MGEIVSRNMLSWLKLLIKLLLLHLVGCLYYCVGSSVLSREWITSNTWCSPTLMIISFSIVSRILLTRLSSPVSIFGKVRPFSLLCKFRIGFGINPFSHELTFRFFPCCKPAGKWSGGRLHLVPALKTSGFTPPFTPHAWMLWCWIRKGANSCILYTPSSLLLPGVCAQWFAIPSLRLFLVSFCADQWPTQNNVIVYTARLYSRLMHPD
jgi:hypothetical protein